MSSICNFFLICLARPSFWSDCKVSSWFFWVESWRNWSSRNCTKWFYEIYWTSQKHVCEFIFFLLRLGKLVSSLSHSSRINRFSVDFNERGIFSTDETFVYSTLTGTCVAIFTNLIEWKKIGDNWVIKSQVVNQDWCLPTHSTH